MIDHGQMSEAAPIYDDLARSAAQLRKPTPTRLSRSLRTPAP
jgi:hypothetical protein